MPTDPKSASSIEQPPATRPASEQPFYKHGKAIAAMGDAIDLLVVAELDEATVAGDDGTAGVVSDLGVVTSRVASAAAELGEAFVLAIAMHRHWNRSVDVIPA